jgi:hypothetical protein
MASTDPVACQEGRLHMIIEVREEEGTEYPDWTGTLEEFLESGMAWGINKTSERALKFLRPNCTLELELDNITYYVTRVE